MAEGETFPSHPSNTMAEQSGSTLYQLLVAPIMDTDQLQNTDVSANATQEQSSETPKLLPITIPNQQNRIRCKECSYTVENEEKMLQHVRKQHRGEHPFQCLMCEYSTYNKTLFEEHVRIHQGVKPFKCSYCPYRSVSKKNTKKHENIHRKDNPYKCVKCDFIGKHALSLQNHMIHHDTNDDLVCLYCNETFVTSKSLISHKKSRKRCPDCSEVFCSKLLTQHRIDNHGYEKPKKVGGAREKKNTFSCALCDWTGSIKPRILLHLIHHPNQDVDESVVDTTILRKFGIMPAFPGYIEED